MLLLMQLVSFFSPGLLRFWAGIQLANGCTPENSGVLEKMIVAHVVRKFRAYELEVPYVS
jgi:hypothetical protein